MRYKPTIKPWPHQAKSLKRLWKLGSALLWADVGTGKTKTVCDYAFARHQAGQVKRVLVVCPLPAVGVWEDEIQANAPRHGELTVPTVNIFSRNQWKSLKDLPMWVDFINSGEKIVVTPIWMIVTYDTLNHYAKVLAEQYRPDLVVFDESQYLRNYSATRTKRALYLSRHATYVLCLSGTPAPNGYVGLYYQLKMVDPTVLPPTMQDFKNEYCKMGGYMNKEIVGYRNVEDLAKKISTATIRITKDELSLPPVIDQRIPVVLDKKARNVYDNLKERLVVRLAEGEPITAQNQLTLLLRLAQITGGFLQDQPVGEQTKLAVLSELVEAENGKLVIWARFLPEIRAIGQLLERLGVTYKSITGSVSGQKRTDIIRSFQDESEPQVLVCQIAALGVGVTLTAASTAIFYSTDWDADSYEQAKGRIHRPGQKRTCRYLHLVAKGTVDETIHQALQAKMSRQQTLAEIVRRLDPDVRHHRKNLEPMPAL